MLCCVAGASGSGKTTLLHKLKGDVPISWGLYDFDDYGVPAGADKVWRQQTTAKWLQQYLDRPKEQDIFCLFGQMVLGEVLACSQVKKISNITFYLIDVEDIERIKRLKARGQKEIGQDILNWASWLRVHQQDPSWQQHVITQGAWQGLDFSYSSALAVWPDFVIRNTIDTTAMNIEDTAELLYQNMKG